MGAYDFFTIGSFGSKPPKIYSEMIVKRDEFIQVRLCEVKKMLLKAGKMHFEGTKRSWNRIKGRNASQIFECGL